MTHATRTIVTCLIFLISACTSDTTSSAQAQSPMTDLTGGEWVVDDINGAGVVDIARATLNFGEDGRVSGSASCNSYGGDYSVDGSSIKFGRMISTRKACPGAIMAQESAFFSVLENASSIKFSDDGALVISGPDGDTMTARRD